MFYVSKVSLLFFILALFGLFLSLTIKLTSLDFTHYGKLAVFGFILPTIVGAFYQIIPNSQQKRLNVEFIGYIVFVLSILNLYYLFVNDFEKSSFFIVAVALLSTIHLAFVINNLKPITVKFLTFANVYMVLSAIFLLLSIKNPNFSLQIAIHTFTIGVMINAVLGVQTAWIPMMYMQELGKTKFAKLFLNISVYIHQLIVLAILLGFYFGNYKIIGSLALIELAFIILFLKFVFYDSIKPQIKIQGIPYQVKFFLTGHIFLLIGLIIAHIIGVSNNFKLIPYHIDFMVYGFGIFTIIGGIIHLAPRIIWNMVYIKKAQAMKQIPNVKGVISRQKAEKLYYVALFGYFIFLSLDILFGGFVASLVYIAFLAIVIFGFLIDFYRLYVL